MRFIRMAAFIALLTPAGLHAQSIPGQYIKKTAWLSNRSNIQQLLRYIAASDELGLNKNDYDYAFINALLSGAFRLSNSTDSAAADSALDASSVRFFKDAVYGNPPDLSYNGLTYHPACLNIPYLINTSISEQSFHLLLDSLECKTPEYRALKKKLGDLLFELKDSIYISKNISDKTTSSAKRSSKAILQRNIRYVSRALSTVRWMNCLLNKNQNTIVVNIPSATLLVYENDKIIFESKVIVGQRSTTTPVFTSEIADITLYPYWHVTKRIATRELLPLIKKDVGYLSANNFQVLDQQGKIVDADSVNWKSLSPENFPYTLRQSTGCDNSLGIIRLNIRNPYNVYMHDTPWKGLFHSQNRFFSHGCIRVEKAMDLARIILNENRIAVDTIEEKGCLLNQHPKTIALTHSVPVLVLYNAAWYDSAANVRLYADVYGRIR